MVGILVVDDEYACRESLKMLLSLEGYRVSAATDGDEALALADENPPDLLIADWVLSGDYNGLQIAESLRMANPNLQVIIVTGYPSVELEARIKVLPCHSFMQKPFKPSEMLALVGKVLRRDG
jgi:DNA-binding response OmpR family regulator